MPSPVAHSLAGLAVAHFALRRRASSNKEPLIVRNSTLDGLLWAASLAFAANAADLDFLPGFLVGHPNKFHHGATHTLMGGLAFGLLVMALARLAGFKPWRRFGWLMSISYCTHLLLDFVTHGNQEPYGMKLFWPLSFKPVIAPFHLFLDIRREPGTLTFIPSLIQRHNLEAIFWELVVMGGVWTLYRVLSSLPFSFNSTAEERETPQ